MKLIFLNYFFSLKKNNYLQRNSIISKYTLLFGSCHLYAIMFYDWKTSWQWRIVSIIVKSKKIESCIFTFFVIINDNRLNQEIVCMEKMNCLLILVRLTTTDVRWMIPKHNNTTTVFIRTKKSLKNINHCIYNTCLLYTSPSPRD